MGEGLPPLVMSGAGNSHQLREELLDSVSVHRLPGDEASDVSFEGFPDPQMCPEALIVSCQQHPLTFWRQLLGVMSSMSSLVPSSRLRMRSLQLRMNATGRSLVDTAVISWDDSFLEDLRWWSV